MITKADLKYLERCVELAKIALEKGDEPFGSVLVTKEGKVLKEDHNRVSGGDHTQHPEFAIARWAAANMTPDERSEATVYTSGEHCPMCAAATDVSVWAELFMQALLHNWYNGLEMGVPLPRVRSLAIKDVIRDTVVEDRTSLPNRSANYIRSFILVRTNEI